MFPTISLTGSAGYASTDLKIKISETEQQIAIADYDKAIPSAFHEVNDAVAARAHIDEHLAAQRRLVAATDTIYKLSTARFRAGIDMSSFLAQNIFFSMVLVILKERE